MTVKCKQILSPCGLAWGVTANCVPCFLVMELTTLDEKCDEDFDVTGDWDWEEGRGEGLDEPCDDLDDFCCCLVAPVDGVEL